MAILSTLLSTLHLHLTRTVLLFLLTGLGVTVEGRQVKPQLTLTKDVNCKRMDISVRTDIWRCDIVPAALTASDAFVIHTNTTGENAGQHKMARKKIDDMEKIVIDLYSKDANTSFSRQILSKSSATKDDIWRMDLARDIPYRLDFAIGMGDTNLDLSGLTIEALKLNVGKANVHIGYKENIANPVVMESFEVLVDMGSLVVDKMSLARCKRMIAEVSFGNMQLDFSQNVSVMSQFIRASVGVGNLIIILPGNKMPIKIIIRDSWLCGANLCKELYRENENEYVNTAYRENSKNALIFDVDVSVGKVIFKRAAE